MTASSFLRLALFVPVMGVVACGSGSATREGASADGGAGDACASESDCAARTPDGGDISPEGGALDGGDGGGEGGANAADAGGCTGIPPDCHGDDPASCCAPDPVPARCSGGQWMCGSAAPPGCDPTPSCNGGKFACGGAMCDTATQFCATLPAGDAGTSTVCSPLPAACSGHPTCSCLEANEHDASCAGGWSCVPYFGVQLRATCM